MRADNLEIVRMLLLDERVDPSADNNDPARAAGDKDILRAIVTHPAFNAGEDLDVDELFENLEYDSDEYDEYE